MSPPHNHLRLSLGLALLAVLTPWAAAQVKPGDLFPKLAGVGLLGKLPETEGRVVLVDFWASWCAPCHASFPAYGRLQAKFSPRGLVILAVSVDESEGDYEAFVRKLAPSFSVVRDATQRLAAGVDVPGMPTSYLVDRNGRVRSVHEGFHSGVTEAELDREIEALLAEK
jgi:thiol-disulfide isomerase/thioredoxin